MRKWFASRSDRQVSIVAGMLIIIACTLGWCSARAACTPDPLYTPTPVVMWDAVNEATVVGHTVYYNEPGGTPQLSVDIPCEWLDMDNDDTVAEFKWCRGVNFELALQKAIPSLLPLTAYEIRVKAYDVRMVRSTNFSNVVTVCMSPVCASTARGVHTPCN